MIQITSNMAISVLSYHRRCRASMHTDKSKAKRVNEEIIASSNADTPGNDVRSRDEIRFLHNFRDTNFNGVQSNSLDSSNSQIFGLQQHGQRRDSNETTPYRRSQAGNHHRPLERPLFHLRNCERCRRVAARRSRYVLRLYISHCALISIRKPSTIHLFDP